MRKNNIVLKVLNSFIFVSFFVTSLYSAQNKQVLLKNIWDNIGYSNAKNVMLSGATTAVGKGYSSLFTNPAGMATNYAVGIYASSVALEHNNEMGAGKNNLATTKEIKGNDIPRYGIFYKYLALEVQKDVHQAIGFAYGLETSFGIFSLGANIVKDKTTIKNYKDFGRGDYKIVGFQWQKSYIDVDGFYAFYFGYSKKSQGVKKQPGELIYTSSPIVQRLGLGFETNIYSTTVLLSLDQSSQSFKNIDDKLDITAIGIKWMIFDGFSLAVGHSVGKYSTDLNLDDYTTDSFGFELGLWQINLAAALLHKEVNDKKGKLYEEENSLHIDISIAF